MLSVSPRVCLKMQTNFVGYFVLVFFVERISVFLKLVLGELRFEIDK